MEVKLADDNNNGLPRSISDKYNINLKKKGKN